MITRGNYHGKEFKMRKRGIVTLIIGAVILVLGIVVPLVFSNLVKAPVTEEVSVLSPQRVSLYIAIALIPLSFALMLNGLFITLFPTFTENVCRASTTVISIAISAFGSLVLVSLFNLYVYVVFNESKLHPVSYPVSFFAALLCFFACCILALIYYHFRRKNYSLQGIAVDLFTMALYFIPMTLFWISVEMFASGLLATLT